MTREEATELLQSKRTCALHKRLCRVMPDGSHVPWSVEAITVWATLIVSMLTLQKHLIITDLSLV